MAETQQLKSKGTGHEPIGVNVRFVLLGAAGLVVLIVLTMWAMGGVLRLLSRNANVEDGGAPMEASARTVGLGLDQAAQRLVMESEQERWLSEYAWLDEEQERARIPIDRAMEIMAEHGIGAVSVADGQAAPPAEVGSRNSTDEDRP